MPRRFQVTRLATYPYALPKPIAHYKANMVWSGIMQVNTTDRTCRRFSPEFDFTTENRALVVVEEMTYPHQLSHVDMVEISNITVYNKHMWAENDQLFIELK
jgi:hypothetical protein